MEVQTPVGAIVPFRRYVQCIETCVGYIRLCVPALAVETIAERHLPVGQICYEDGWKRSKNNRKGASIGKTWI